VVHLCVVPGQDVCFAPREVLSRRRVGALEPGRGEVFLSPTAAISQWSSHGQIGGVALIFIHIFVVDVLLTTWVLGIVVGAEGGGDICGGGVLRQYCSFLSPRQLVCLCPFVLRVSCSTSCGVL
jgi:hypothetical protein